MRHYVTTRLYPKSLPEHKWQTCLQLFSVITNVNVGLVLFLSQNDKIQYANKNTNDKLYLKRAFTRLKRHH